MYESRWTAPRPIVGKWNEECFLAHLTGASNASRIEILNNNFNGYLTK
jgi:hypothetical protein